MSNFKKISKNIQLITITNPQKTNSVDWINVNNAGKAEIEYLRKTYGFSLPHLRAAAASANSQRPLIDRSENYVFLILHFPVIDGKSEKIQAAEIDFFIGHGFLITMPGQPFAALNDFFNLGKKDGNSLLSYEFESSAILLYEILKKLLEYSYVILDHNSLNIAQAEKIVLGEDQKQAATLVLNLRHNLVNMRKIMQSHKNIIKQLEAMESKIIPRKELNKYYGELINQTKNIWEILENQREMVEVLYASYESQSNYRLSNIMKTLTIFYVIFSSLSLVAAVFSLKINDGMPFINYQNGFWMIIAIMGIIGLSMLLLFKKKKWL